MSRTANPKRILIATIGSLGDLHPCLALAIELKQRGHHVTICASTFYQPRIEALGLGFHPLHPNWDPGDQDKVRRCEDMKRGVEVLFRELLLPELPGSYDDLLHAAASQDLLLAGEAVFAAPLVAEKLRMPWASVILSPCSFLSAHDPAVLPNVPHAHHLAKLGWPVYRAAMELGRLTLHHWWKPMRDFRRQQGLRISCDPIFRDKLSDDLVLALFSRAIALPQPDWPTNVIEPGYVFYDQLRPGAPASPELNAFLAAGEPPIVFTLGTSAIHNPGNFFSASAEAARRLKRRALLVGPSKVDAMFASPSTLAVAYAPYSEVFPRAAAIVHQGGSGTTAQAMRAGKPMLIVPYGWDQPDNAARIVRRGAGVTVTRKAYSAATATRALRQLLEEPSFAHRAEKMAATMQQEDGLTTACDAIESLLAAGTIEEDLALSL